MSHVSVKQLAMMACLGICSLAAPPAQAATVHQVVPVSFTTFVSCANGGAGESVTLSGDLHEMVHYTSDNANGIHVKVQINYQGISGVGATTGLKYQAFGMTTDEYNSHIGYEETTIGNFIVIGEGPNNDVLVHVNAHITILADGTVTSFVDNESVECK